MNKPLWTPDKARIDCSNWKLFCDYLTEHAEFTPQNPHALYDWSVQQPEKFWEAVWHFCQVIASQQYTEVLSDGQRMPGARWFSGAKLNYAENLLRHRDSKTAIIFHGEDKVRRELTYHELYRQVACVQTYLKEAGIKAGDRVAGSIPNMPEAIVCMLETASLGAVWTSCSPDFGVSGVVDRFGQSTPRVLLAADGYFFKGKTIETLDKTAQILQAIPQLERVILVPYTRPAADLSAAFAFDNFAEIIQRDVTEPVSFAQLPFDHPLYIMYSSGTTGVPKCIVHSAGGTLLEHLKEHILHTDLKPEDRIFYQTTCGWMMWNWLVSALAAGSTLVLYDGSPLINGGSTLFDLADKEQIGIFGTNAKFIASIEKDGLEPAKTHKLSQLKSILSTGSPLAPESFDYIYSKVKADVNLASISGGTDIIGCFALGCPVLPVHRGELQIRSLGLKVEVFDAAGQSLSGQKGELVCTAPFPSMPVCFWNDADGSRYQSAYFKRYPGIWHHGDFTEITEQRGLIIYGRSDAVLNPGGVRIGSAEIYRQVEQLPEIIESLVIGQEWNKDVRVVLFVRLRDDLTLDDNLRDRIKRQIRSNASPFHVPSKIIQVSDIPRTRSGKIVELAVREVVHGRPVENIEALANPEALDFFRHRPELQESC